MKNYIYVSATKLQYLSPQVKISMRERVASRLKLGMPGIEMEFSKPSNDANDLMGKLERVKKFIVESELDKGTWEHLTLDVSFAYLNDPSEEFLLFARIGGEKIAQEIRQNLETSGKYSEEDIEDTMDRFDGTNREGAQFILLSGSAKHIVGNTPDSQRGSLNLSYFHVIQEHLHQFSSTAHVVGRRNGDAGLEESVSLPTHILEDKGFFPRLSYEETAWVIAALQQKFEPPSLRIETIALKLFDQPVKHSRGSRSYIYTPLYVAYT